MPTLMTLEEAREVRDAVARARARQCLTGLPGPLIQLAGATIAFCRQTGARALSREDLGRQALALRRQWEGEGKPARSRTWHVLMAAERLLENWKDPFPVETLDLDIPIGVPVEAPDPD